MSAHAEHHITSKKMLIQVFGALVFLTVLTVATAQLDLGVMNIPVALAIALTKAGLVVFIFMALWWDNKVNLLVFGLGALFVVVFLAFTLLDTAFRGDLPNTEEGTVQDETRRNEALQNGHAEEGTSDSTSH